MPGSQRLESAVEMVALDWEIASPDNGVPPLASDSIHLWTLDLAREGPGMARYLAESDRRRAERIVQPDKRRLYLGGRAGMRCLLSAYTGISPPDLVFTYGPRGKPELDRCAAANGPRFNYSLSRDKVLYALARDRELGVDMEALPRRTSAALLARRTLTASENSAWRSLPESLRNDAMLCAWTRKEAFGKALGVGIRYHLGAVTLFSDTGRSRFNAPRSGLFGETDPTGMPEVLEGLQLRMPFPAVATLMYSVDSDAGPAPRLQGRRLELGIATGDKISRNRTGQ